MIKNVLKINQKVSFMIFIKNETIIKIFKHSVLCFSAEEEDIDIFMTIWSIAFAPDFYL